MQFGCELRSASPAASFWTTRHCHLRAMQVFRKCVPTPHGQLQIHTTPVGRWISMRMPAKALDSGLSGDKSGLLTSLTLVRGSSMATKAGALCCSCPGKARWRSPISRHCVWVDLMTHGHNGYRCPGLNARLGHLGFELCAVKPPYQALLFDSCLIVSTISFVDTMPDQLARFKIGSPRAYGAPACGSGRQFQINPINF